MKRLISAMVSRIMKIRDRLGRKPGEKDMILGQVLVHKKLITPDQLAKALTLQQQKLVELGQAVPLGIIIADLGFAAEDDLVRAVNEHYRLSVSSLSDNIKDLVGKLRGTFVERLPRPRLPIWFQLSVTTTLVITCTAALLNYMVFSRQKERLYLQCKKIGLVSLHYFDTNARIPLLEDNVLRLNTLIKNATEVEGILYAIIVDHRNRIRAHTDLSKIGTVFEPFKPQTTPVEEDGTVLFNHVLPDGKHVLDLSQPILFKGKTLGKVYVGVSIDFINDLIRKELGDMILLTLLIILFGVVVAVLLGFRYSRPIQKLVLATEEVSRGNYHHRVQMASNDELGNLAAAFNRMNAELWKNSLMQESFGKYVGNEVLELILANPQSTWLKGHRNEATIFFADIRGFTAYSETEEPETVVEMLNLYFEIATQSIVTFGGYVDKFIGDAVLGVFGVPVFRKDHVERAVRAALHMQRKLKEAAKHDNRLITSVGIGIDTGIVVSGNIGSQAKMEYTVIGDSVNVASRLYGIAGPGEVIISPKAYDSIRDLVSVEALPSQHIKGKLQPLDVYKVLDIRNRPHLAPAGPDD